MGNCDWNMWVVTADEMQAMDRQTIEAYGIPGQVLMENAGRGATRLLMDHFPDILSQKVGVMAGKGNNGGDGFVMARYLHAYGVAVTVFLLGEAGQVKGDAEKNLKLLGPLNVPVVEMPDPKAFGRRKKQLGSQELWVDAILGTGLNADVRGYYRQVIEYINAGGKPVFSVDIPSGLNGDTGQICGISIQAAATATFAFAKIGHVVFPGAGLTGLLGIVDIGIPRHIRDQIGPRQWLLTSRFIADAIKIRSAQDHKGTAGHLLVVAGAAGKTGAAMMTSTAAMRTGAGLVTLGVPAGVHSLFEGRTLEVMTEPLPANEVDAPAREALPRIMSLLEGKKCLALGPGIGTAATTADLVKSLVTQVEIPLVLDADGLNCMVGNLDVLKARTAPTVLTPHPGEMARLLGISTQAVQQDRVACARKFAIDFQVHLILKGARTAIATPDGRVFVNPTGNAAMATGGMGDVLTGIVAGLITQGYPVEIACQVGTYLHGAAADTLARKKGPVGILASDVIGILPEQSADLTDWDNMAARTKGMPELRGI